MPAVVGKLEHELAIYLRRSALHCIYREQFISEQKNPNQNKTIKCPKQQQQTPNKTKNLSMLLV